MVAICGMTICVMTQTAAVCILAAAAVSAVVPAMASFPSASAAMGSRPTAARAGTASCERRTGCAVCRTPAVSRLIAAVSVTRSRTASAVGVGAVVRMAAVLPAVMAVMAARMSVVVVPSVPLSPAFAGQPAVRNDGGRAP